MANSAPASTLDVRRLAAVSDAQLQALCEVLVDCVEGGASVSFMWPLPRQKALAFWQSVIDSARRGERIVLVAVGSPHREAAFEACEFLVDWLKTKAPFWKLEETPAGEKWVGAHTGDDQAAARWEKKKA